MRIRPLVLHAAARLPVCSTDFSDQLDVGSLNVEKEGKSTITCNSTHGVSVGNEIPVCITQNNVPLAVKNVTLQNGDEALFEFTANHDITMGHCEAALFTGFTNDQLNGPLLILEVPTSNQVVVNIPEDIESITLNGNEILLEPLHDDIVGWHVAEAISGTELEFNTPLRVFKNYNSSNVSICTNIRIWQALDFDRVHERYHEYLKADKSNPSKCYLFITPAQRSTLSKDRRAETDATVEAGPSAFSQQMLIDGFQVYALVPTHNDPGGCNAMDLCQGDIFVAMLKTFNGMQVYRPELLDSDRYVTWLTAHGPHYFDGAIYVHEYVFEAPVLITSNDSITPQDVTRINPENNYAVSQSPEGSSKLVRIEIKDDGVTFKGQPQPLTANIELET